MLKRVVFGIIVSVVAFAVIWFGDIVMAVGLMICAAIGLKEYCDAFKRKGFRPLLPVMASSLLAFCITFSHTVNGEPGIGDRETLILYGLLAVAEVMITMAVTVVFHKKYTFLDGAASIFGCIYVVGFTNFFLLLRSVGEADTGFFGKRSEGFYLVILAVAATAMADTFALFAGKAFGKKKLIPAVSPNKTVAGSVGAIAGAIITSVVYGLIMIKTGAVTLFSWYDYLIVGTVIGVISQIGDLFASSMKRFCGIKDFGKLIPGHGGILDRIDSHMFVVPFVYFYVVLLTII